MNESALIVNKYLNIDKDKLKKNVPQDNNNETIINSITANRLKTISNPCLGF